MQKLNKLYLKAALHLAPFILILGGSVSYLINSFNNKDDKEVKDEVSVSNSEESVEVLPEESFEDTVANAICEEILKSQIKEKEVTETPVKIEEKVDIVVPYKSVTALTNVNVRKKAIDGELMGTLCEGDSLRLLEVLDNGWYKVDYYGDIGFISNEFAFESVDYEVNSEIKKVYYVVEEIELRIHDLLKESLQMETVMLPALECIEVYEENEDSLLVKTSDYIGYIEKTNLEELTGNFAVVDISEQEVILYSNNEIILRAPVVTGAPGTPTDLGIFAVYDKSTSRYLVGEGYRSYVDIMTKYNGGEGFHDSTYHTHEDGFEHGWRAKHELGGDTYKYDGSHGCVNMNREEALTVGEYLELGDKVLVKK